MYIQLALIAFLASEVTGKFEILPKLLNFIQYGENELCKMESDLYRKNIGNYTIWAHKMLDSSAKSTFGILRGIDYQLGNYDECLNIDGPFPTQYCLVGVAINVPSQISTKQLNDDQHKIVFEKLKHDNINNVNLGMCFPSSCSASDIQTSLTETLNKRITPFKTAGVTYNVSSSEELCSNYVNPKIFGVQEITFSILSFTLVILVLIGTLWNCFGKAKKNPDNYFYVKKMCLSFSIQRNWKELFKFQGNREKTQILNGIRSISVILIFSGHFFLLVSFIPTINNLSIHEVYNSKIRLAVEKMDVIVDTFFVMSGLLLVHGTLKKWKTVYFNPIWLIVLRYIRLTPLNLYVSLYFVTMFPYFGSGPMWNLTYVLYKGCIKKNYWWLNILYINNFTEDVRNTCNSVNWYVSCDFQLSVVCILVLFITKKNLRVGYAILGLLLILSIIASFTITKISGYAPYMEYESKEYVSFWNNDYIKPYTRGSSYFVGMIGGIVYDKLTSKRVKLSKANSYVFTGFSVLAMVVLYSYLFFSYNEKEDNRFKFALYTALQRPIWSIGVLGICIVASFGSIPAIRLFLSSSFWTPLAKLSYGFYLSHMVVQHAILSTLNKGIRIEFFNMMNLWLALLGTSLIISPFLYLIVEAPFMQTLRIFTQAKFYEKPFSNENAAVEIAAVTKIE